MDQDKDVDWDDYYLLADFIESGKGNGEIFPYKFQGGSHGGRMVCADGLFISMYRDLKAREGY